MCNGCVTDVFFTFILKDALVCVLVALLLVLVVGRSVDSMFLAV